MKVAFCVLVAVALVGVYADNEKALDEFDYDSLLNNPAKLKDAVDCVVGKKACGELEKFKDGSLKRLTTNCGECTSEQRAHYERVLSSIKAKYPEDFAELQKLMKKD
uniref:Chemosensory protein 8 n=1 Tax=Clostera restitura TaxID=2008422 RepID=A0A385XRT6_9NEOP|nr:chemosensory protein 8 [Clostera restitura]